MVSALIEYEPGKYVPVHGIQSIVIFKGDKASLSINKDGEIVKIIRGCDRVVELSKEEKSKSNFYWKNGVMIFAKMPPSYESEKE